MRAIEPILLKGGDTVKTMSAEFLADVEQHWRQHDTKILDVVAEKHPQAYFAGMVSLARIIKWEIGTGRKLFEQFLKQVNRLQEPAGG